MSLEAEHVETLVPRFVVYNFFGFIFTLFDGEDTIVNYNPTHYDAILYGANDQFPHKIYPKSESDARTNRLSEMTKFAFPHFYDSISVFLDQCK